MTDTENMFDAGKIGVFCDSITHSTEDRRGTDTKIVVLGLRIDPFDAKLAIVLDQRLRNSLFSLADASPYPHIRRVDAALGVLRQNLHVYTTPETGKASMALMQVAISAVAAKVHKDRNEFSLTFKASFGPADKHELEFVEAWRNSQRFLTFERSEPSLDFDDVEADEVDPGPVVDGRHKPMWDDGDEAAAPETDAAREVGATPAKKRGTRKKAGKHDPDKERTKQVKAARSKTAKGGKANGAAAHP